MSYPLEQNLIYLIGRKPHGWFARLSERISRSIKGCDVIDHNGQYSNAHSPEKTKFSTLTQALLCRCPGLYPGSSQCYCC